jgi:hypothetical protein
MDQQIFSGTARYYNQFRPRYPRAKDPIFKRHTTAITSRGLLGDRVSAAAGPALLAQPSAHSPHGHLVPGRLSILYVTAAADKREGGPAQESEGEHRAGELVGRGVPQGGAHVVEDEQPRGGDRVGERLAVADREERIRAAVHNECRQG